MSLSLYTADDYLRLLKNNYEMIIVDIVNKLIADEWVASFNYYVGIYTARERYDIEIVQELKTHRDEEIRHGDMLAEMLQRRFNTGPLRNIEMLTSESNCENIITSSSDLLIIAEEQKQGEICAIKHYKEAIAIAKLANDSETAKVFQDILEDEIEHRNDLQKFIDKLRNENAI